MYVTTYYQFSIYILFFQKLKYKGNSYFLYCFIIRISLLKIVYILMNNRVLGN